MRTRALSFLLLTALATAQTPVNERVFAAPPSSVEAALKKIPGGTSGPLPVLEGFVSGNSRSSDRYQRPYYQCSVKVTSSQSGGALVRVSAKITAWSSDSAHPGYKVLESNGRIESDLLDRLQQALGAEAANSKAPVDSTKKTAVVENTERHEADAAKTSTAQTAKVPSARVKADPPPDISAPVRQVPSFRDLKPPANTRPDTEDPGLAREAKSLEDILRNQSHPTNLVAVRQAQTPVLQSPRSDAQVLFLANAEDEFEILSTNPNWVYVRISGLSRGWLLRSSVEMLNDAEGPNNKPVEADKPQVDKPQMLANGAATQKTDLFVVSSEQTGSFPGQWERLKGQTVKIISVQQAPGTQAITANEKLQFAQSQFKREAVPGSSAAGVVLIFDSEDGGMVAATRASLEQWKSGSLSDRAFWTQCYFDPPDIFSGANQ